MKHAIGRNNDHCTKKNNPNSGVKLAGSKEIKSSTGKSFKLAGATKVEGKKARKRG